MDSYFGAGGIGGVSWSVPAVLTAKLLHPNRPCICVCGDGGFAMQIHVLSTALQYKTPVIFVIMNDSRFGMVGESQGTRRIGTDFIDTDFAKIANAFGCQGVRVKQPEEIAPALERGLKSEVPMVIDVIINREEKMYAKLLSPLAKEALKEIGFRQEMKGDGFKG